LRRNFSLLRLARTGDQGKNPLRKTALIGAVIGTILVGVPAAAQYYGGIPTGRILLPACYDPNFRHDASRLPKIIPYAEQAMDKYLGLARSSSNLDKMFTGTREHRLMMIDGAQVDPRTTHDPWAARIAKVEPVGYVQSNEDLNMHAQWRAIAGDGALLGTYDAFIRAGVGGYHIRQLKLISAGSNVQADELRPFCVDPGDIEKWQEKKAQRDAEKAARAAVQH
jgi:hypothetical protein